ncbi:MAG: hypothetical protein ACFFAH_17240 [Promethearchaeota archaeon]
MRNKILYIYTEELKFFYLLNKELNRLKIKFKVLNLGDKIPNIPCILITTFNELKKIKNYNRKKVNILSYNKKEDFNQFILKILASYRIGYKEDYSNLIFSIDPGTKHIGLVVFLDEYYLNSHTVYNKADLIRTIKNYVNSLQMNNQNLIDVIFKFGIGILPITKDLINSAYKTFKSRGKVKIYLIDESKSSKIKVYENKRKIPKHEASALVLSFRNGVEVNKKNLQLYLNSNKLKKENFVLENLENTNNITTLSEIAEKVINGELSLSESTEMFKNAKIQNHKII